MKKVVLLSIILFAVAIISEAQSQSKIYFIKSGYVKYVYSGNSSGTRELWWDDYGQKTCELVKKSTTTKMLFVKNTTETHKLTIVDNGIIWDVDYIKNKGTKGNVPLYNGKPMNEMSEKEQQELADKTIADLGGRKLGNEKVMGYDCEVIKLLGSKIWNHKNITIKSESKILGVEISQKAEVFKPNAKVPASQFTPPSDVEYEEMHHKVDLANLMQTAGNEQQRIVSEEAQKADLEDKDDKLIATQYPFAEFLAKTDAFNYNGYEKLSAMYEKYKNNAMYKKGITNFLYVVVMSENNKDVNQDKHIQKFKHNGKTYMYGENKQKSSFIMHKIKYNSYIKITTEPKESKDEMLKISDNFGL